MRRVPLIGLLALAACLGDSASPVERPPPGLDGPWRASWTDASGGGVVANLEVSQAGAAITGVAYVRSERHSIAGAVFGDSTVRITFRRGDSDFAFEGRVDSPIRLTGRIIGYYGDPVETVFVKQPDQAAPFVRVAGTWESSWTDAGGSWSMVVTLDQISEQLVVTGGTLAHTTEPVVEVGIDGGSSGAVDGTVGTQGGVIFSVMTKGSEPPPRRFSFEGRLTSAATLAGALLDFTHEGSSQAITMRR